MSPPGRSDDEDRDLSARYREITERLHRERKVFLGTPIDDFIARFVIKEILTLSQEDPRQPISFLVNSPGGLVDASLGIYDAIRRCGAPVWTFCIGAAQGMAALLVAAGAKDRRFSLPNARFGLTAMRGSESDANKLKPLTDKVATLLGRLTGREAGRIAEDMAAELHMTPVEALDYGLVDEIVDDPPASR